MKRDLELYVYIYVTRICVIVNFFDTNNEATFHKLKILQEKITSNSCSKYNLYLFN